MRDGELHGVVGFFPLSQGRQTWAPCDPWHLRRALNCPVSAGEVLANPWVPRSARHKVGVVSHPSNHSTWQGEAGGSGVQGFLSIAI